VAGTPLHTPAWCLYTAGPQYVWWNSCSYRNSQTLSKMKPVFWSSAWGLLESSLMASLRLAMQSISSCISSDTRTIFCAQDTLSQRLLRVTYKTMYWIYPWNHHAILFLRLQSKCDHRQQNGVLWLTHLEPAAGLMKSIGLKICVSIRIKFRLWGVLAVSSPSVIILSAIDHIMEPTANCASCAFHAGKVHQT
jgi:hypothetical protein